MNKKFDKFAKEIIGLLKVLTPYKNEKVEYSNKENVCTIYINDKLKAASFDPVVADLVIQNKGYDYALITIAHATADYLYDYQSHIVRPEINWNEGD
ncbi:MAG: hypothetical protein ACR2PH_02550 [Desulfobulbia bacterium]